jgi:hypothetical protein
MVEKHPLCPQRIRKIPKTFSWVDHRLVRDHYIDRLTHPEAALYLFLLTVADSEGLSYYSEHSLSERLSMDPALLQEARSNLIRIGLIAYQKPLYQVLEIEEHFAQIPRGSSGLQSLAHIFKQIGEGAS